MLRKLFLRNDAVVWAIRWMFLIQRTALFKNKYPFWLKFGCKIPRNQDYTVDETAQEKNMIDALAALKLVIQFYKKCL